MSSVIPSSCRGASAPVCASAPATLVVADLLIGYRMVRERFTSRVILDRPGRIDVSYSDGPFRYLNNHWLFQPEPDGGCIIDFYVDFEFRSRMLQRIIELLFNEAVRRMVGAFEARAPAGSMATTSASTRRRSKLADDRRRSERRASISDDAMRDRGPAHRRSAGPNGPSAPTPPRRGSAPNRSITSITFCFAVTWARCRATCRRPASADRE